MISDPAQGTPGTQHRFVIKDGTFGESWDKTCIMDTSTQPSSALVLSPTYSHVQTCPSPRTAFHHPNPVAGPFYRLCPSPHVATRIHDICCALPPPTSQGLFPRCEGVFQPLLIYFSLYACLKDYLQRYLF